MPYVFRLLAAALLLPGLLLCVPAFCLCKWEPFAEGADWFMGRCDRVYEALKGGGG